MFGASSDNPRLVSHMKTNDNDLSPVPRDLWPLARILTQRDNIDAHDAWHNVIRPALDALDALLDDSDSGLVDESDFMSEHFSLEPDLFPLLLDHVV